MEESKLFGNVWRFNALIIACVGILAIIFLVFSIYMIVNETSRNRHRHEIVNVDPETQVEEVFRLGRIAYINGSESVIVPLYSDQRFSLKYSGSKSTASTRNILFSNMRKRSNKWLLPHNKYLIANHRLVNETNPYDSDQEIITILYYIVKSDTNNDSRLTENDKITLAFSDPEGATYREVLKGIDEILGYEVLDKKAMAIMFNRGNQGFTAYINLSGFVITEEIALPKFN